MWFHDSISRNIDVEETVVQLCDVFKLCFPVPSSDKAGRSHMVPLHL